MKQVRNGAVCLALLAVALPPGYSQINDFEPVDWAVYDFIPGHQLLFFDDFTGDPIGEPPVAWNVSKEAKIEVVQDQNRNWLHAVTEAVVSPAGLRPPKRFTIEMDFQVLEGSYSGRYRIDLIGANEEDWASLTLEPFAIFFSRSTGLTFEKAVELKTGIHHVAMQADGGAFKCYVNHVRVINIPNTGDFRASRVEVFMPGADQEVENDDKCLITNFTVASGPAPMREQLNASGKIVAYGIYFVNGKATILPQSTPTLKQIAELLAADASLSFSIESHDNEFDEQSQNMKLSEERAVAIKDHLMETYRIASNRLSTRGWGETRPLGEPDTVDGRRMNQRVELIRK